MLESLECKAAALGVPVARDGSAENGIGIVSMEGDMGSCTSRDGSTGDVGGGEGGSGQAEDLLKLRASQCTCNVLFEVKVKQIGACHDHAEKEERNDAHERREAERGHDDVA